MVNAITIQNYRAWLEETRASDEKSREYLKLHHSTDQNALSIPEQHRACEFELDKLEVRLATAQSMIDIIKNDTGLPHAVYACDEWLQEAGGA